MGGNCWIGNSDAVEAALWGGMTTLTVFPVMKMKKEVDSQETKR